MERIKLAHVVAVDDTAAAVGHGAGTVEPAHEDRRVIVRPCGVERPSDLPGPIRSNGLPLRIDLLSPGVLADQDRIGQAVRNGCKTVHTGTERHCGADSLSLDAHYAVTVGTGDNRTPGQT